MLAHMWPYFLILRESILSSTEAAPPYVPTAVQEAPVSPHPRRHLLLHIIRIAAVLTGEALPRGGLTCISLVMGGGEHPVGHLCISFGAVSVQQAASSPLRFWVPLIILGAPLRPLPTSTLCLSSNSAPSCKSSSRIGLGPPFDLTLTGYICNNLASKKATFEGAGRSRSTQVAATTATEQSAWFKHQTLISHSSGGRKAET